MQNTNKPQLKMPIYAIIALLTAFAVITATAFGWLSDGNTLIFPSSFNGSATPAYFAGGDGSEKNPYEISNAVHLYNLAWLQYLGYFNMRVDTNADGTTTSFNNKLTQSHFVLKNDIDMKGRAIPPIGTTEYPFIGTFNGANFTVRHLTIANEKGDSLLKITPSNAKWNGTMLTRIDGADEISVLGMFGVVGDYNNYVATYKEAHDDFSESVMNVSSFYIDLLHVKSSSSSTLCGLAAGYVGGNFSKIGVYKSDINFVSGATGIASLSGSNTVLSKYSLVGAYNENLVTWGDDPSDGSGDFGATIDMKTLARRLTYMYAQGEKSDGGDVSKSSVFNTNLASYVSYYGVYHWNSATSGGAMYLGDGTFLPLDIDKEAMAINTWDVTSDGDSKEINVTETIGGKTYTFKTNGIYSKNTGEVFRSKIGYIVGDSSGSDSTVYIRKHSISSTETYAPGIFYSFENNQIDDGTLDGTYNKNRFAMYTMRGNKTYRIYDNINNADTKNYPTGSYTVDGNISAEEFVRYTDVRADIDEMLSSSTVYNGIRFDPYYSSDVISTANDGTVTATYTTDNEGVQYIKGGINFEVKKPGYITTVLACGYEGSIKHNLFDLYKVEKTNGQIDKVTRIDKIYKDSSGTVYYDDEIPGDVNTEDIFSIKAYSTKQSLMPYSSFYFEIPVKDGSYFISHDKSNKATGSTYSAYIMYLDIGISGNSGSDKTYKMESVDFVNTDTVPLNDANEKYYPEYDAVLIKLSDVNQSNAAYVVFIRDNDLTDGSYKLKYRVVYLTADDLSKKYAYPDPDDALEPFPDG